MNASELAPAYQLIQSQILECLKHELACLNQLNDLLQEEFSLLSDNRIAQLEPLTQQKKQALAALETASQSRIALLQTQGFPVELTALVVSPQLSSNASTLVAELSQQLAVCRQFNLTNGRLIQHKGKLATQTLNILRPERSGELYSSKGKADTSNGSRTLGKA